MNVCISGGGGGQRLLETGNLESIMFIYDRLPKGGVGAQRLQVGLDTCWAVARSESSVVVVVCRNYFTMRRVDLCG